MRLAKLQVGFPPVPPAAARDAAVSRPAAAASAPAPAGRHASPPPDLGHHARARPPLTHTPPLRAHRPRCAPPGRSTALAPARLRLSRGQVAAASERVVLQRDAGRPGPGAQGRGGRGGGWGGGGARRQWRRGRRGRSAAPGGRARSRRIPGPGCLHCHQGLGGGLPRHWPHRPVHCAVARLLWLSVPVWQCLLHTVWLLLTPSLLGATLGRLYARCLNIGSLSPL